MSVGHGATNKQSACLQVPMSLQCMPQGLGRLWPMGTTESTSPTLQPCPHTPASTTDHNPLQLVDGALILELSCPGSFLRNLSSGQRLSDGQWHSVWLEVKDASARLQVDGTGADLELPGSCKGPELERELLLGGQLLATEPPQAAAQVSHGFRGCLDTVAINGAAVELLGTTEAGWLERRALDPCCSWDPQNTACRSNPCVNGGQCAPEPGAGKVAQPPCMQHTCLAWENRQWEETHGEKAPAPDHGPRSWMLM